MASTRLDIDKYTFFISHGLELPTFHTLYWQMKWMRDWWWGRGGKVHTCSTTRILRLFQRLFPSSVLAEKTAVAALDTLLFLSSASNSLQMSRQFINSDVMNSVSSSLWGQGSPGPTQSAAQVFRPGPKVPSGKYKKKMWCILDNNWSTLTQLKKKKD